MKQLILLFILFFCFAAAYSQQQKVLSRDSVLIEMDKKDIEKPKATRFLVPKKAAMFSAALPGLGQAYNHKYWKIPILYAGIAATAWGINWNNQYYTLYRNAYIDLLDSDPESKRYLEIPSALSKEELAADIENNRSSYVTALERKKDGYRRDRDLVIIVMVGVYVINIIDANVDAHLSDFDISNDLSMNVSPVLLSNHAGTGNYSLGMSFKLNF